MATVSEDLDKVQEKLHDSAVLWSRTELLGWYNDGYRQFLAQSEAVRRILILDIPGRFSYTHMYDWEQRYLDGTFWRVTHPAFDLARQVAFLWEVEALDGLTPNASLDALTQQWERAYSDETDRHFRFALPKYTERIKRIAWDDRLLSPVSVRELDDSQRNWMRSAGLPRWWTDGVGKNASIEVFQIRTDYNQAYELTDSEAGIPREISGDRTYAVSSEIDLNSYGYTTSGDSEALTIEPKIFAPQSAHTNGDDFVFSPAPTYRFTHPADFPGNGTQLWEVATGSETGINLGTFPWERAHGGNTPTPDDLINIEAFGWRFTQAAATVSNGFAVFIWEKEHLDGETTFTDSGTITPYPWLGEALGITRILFGLGSVRSMSSSERQYLATGAQHTGSFGTIRNWQSSANSLSITHVVVPETLLSEADTTTLLPAQMNKYLRYYTFSRAFGRQGEGQQPILAAHYESRFQRGVVFLKRLADLSHKDKTIIREPLRFESRRPPRVRFPSTFPRIDF